MNEAVIKPLFTNTTHRFILHPETRIKKENPMAAVMTTTIRGTIPD
jgi:hypothetical protein